MSPMRPEDVLAIRVRAANPGPLWDEEEHQACQADREALLAEVARQRSDAEILRYAQEVVARRMDGSTALLVSCALEELAEGVEWAKANGLDDESRITVMFDLAWTAP